MSTELYIDVTGSPYEASGSASDLERFLRQLTDNITFKRIPNQTGHQDFGSSFILFMTVWAPTVLGAALGQWAAMRPHARVRLSRRRNADGSLEIFYDGPASAVTAELLERAFCDD